MSAPTLCAVGWELYEQQAPPRTLIAAVSDQVTKLEQTHNAITGVHS